MGGQPSRRLTLVPPPLPDGLSVKYIDKLAIEVWLKHSPKSVALYENVIMDSGEVGFCTVVRVDDRLYVYIGKDMVEKSLFVRS
jgi:hypothetical protein